MKKASKYLIGKHNYRSFVSGYRNNYDSEIYNISFKKNKDKLIIEFVGKSFYRYMVRNMVGALIKVGNKSLSLNEFKELIDSNKECSTFTIPACGLYLEGVDY